MTKDTYLRTVQALLVTEPEIRVRDSQLTKLNALGREVERGIKSPRDTVGEIEALFHPYVGRHLREALERALR